MQKSFLILITLMINSFAFCQYSNNLDKEFAINGRLSLEFIDSEIGTSKLLVRLDDNNDIYIAYKNTDEIAIFKYDENGDVVEEFGFQGKLSLPYSEIYPGQSLGNYKVIDSLHFIIPPNDQTACIFSFNSNGIVQDNLNSPITNNNGIESPIIFGFDVSDKYLYKLIGRDYSEATLNYQFEILRYNLDGVIDTSYNYQLDETIIGAPIIEDYPRILVLDNDEIYMQVTTSSDNTFESKLLKIKNNGELDSTFANSGYYILNESRNFSNEMNTLNNILYHGSMDRFKDEFIINSYEISSESSVGLEVLNSRIFDFEGDLRYRNKLFTTFDETIFYLEEIIDSTIMPRYSIVSFDLQLNETEFYGNSYKLILGEYPTTQVNDLTIDSYGRHYVILRDEEVNQLIRLDYSTTNNITTSTLDIPKIYPTIIESFLKIELNQSNFKTYTLFNSNGNLIDKGKLTKAINIIDLPNLQEGIYIIKLQNNQGESISRKLVKLKN